MMSGAGAGEMDLDMANSVAENGSNSTSTNAFPLARVKKIIKADKDVNLVSAEAVHLTSMATELFLEFLVKKATEVSLNEKRRTILYKDFATVVKNDSRLAFLHELIPEMVSVQAALEAQRSRSLMNQSMATTASTSNTHSPTSTPSKQGSAESVNSETSKSHRPITDFFAKKPAPEVDIEDMQ